MKKSRYSAEWFEKVLNSMTDMILVKGDKSKLVWANKSFLDYYGLTQEQLKDIIDSPHSNPDDTIQYVRDDHFVFSRGTSLNVTEAVSRHDGQVLYFDTIKDPVFDEHKNTILTVGSSRLLKDEDLVSASGSEHIERKSSTSELRSLIVALPFATIMLDAVDRVITTSSQWNEVFGPENSIIVNKFFDELYGTVMPSLNEEIQLVKRKNNLFENKELKTRIKNEAKTFHIRIKPWALPNGDIGGTIIIAEDITLLSEAEAKLKKHNEDLEIMVEARTRELLVTLDNLKNTQALLMSHEKEAALGRMAGSVAHEINNPLAIINATVNTIKKRASKNDLQPEFLSECLHDITSTVERVEKIVLGLRNVSRDTGTFEVSKVNFNDVLNDVLSLNEQRFKNHSIDLEVITNKLSDPYVCCDHVQLSQVLINLINNAFDAMEDSKDGNEKWLKIHLEDSANTMIISLTDSGPGIPEEIEDKIFEPFFTSKPVGQGTGLGLAISRGIIEKHNGTIDLDKNSSNTKFVIKLPKIL